MNIKHLADKSQLHIIKTLGGCLYSMNEVLPDFICYRGGWGKLGTFLHVAHFLKLSLNFELQNATGTTIRVLRNIIMQIS